MRWFGSYALLPSGLEPDVTFEVEGGRFVSVTPGTAPAGATLLPGVVLPGLANAHSHAFHRALRGRTHDGSGDFWTWRERMYAVAGRVDPDSYLALARATYAEMALAGISTVGEFHYLHHGPGGQPYHDPNAMGEALRQAASDAGIRLTLLDTCYLSGGLGPSGHLPMDEVQQRFSDHDVAGWAARVGLLKESEGMRVGVAAHSVRAVPQEGLPTIAQVASGRPLHAHLSEQPAENVATLQFYGATPTEVMAQAGLLGPHSTVVHATHLTRSDIATLGGSGTTACFCPTTERDLADGIGPASRLLAAGSPLSLGSDQHAVIDLIEEGRALEMHERLESLQRGHFTQSQLLDVMTAHESLGWPDAGRLEAGARADLVAVRLDSVRTAGSDPSQVLLAATAADVQTVVVDGRTVVSGGQHTLGDVGHLLAESIANLWDKS